MFLQNVRIQNQNLEISMKTDLMLKENMNLIKKKVPKFNNIQGGSIFCHP